MISYNPEPTRKEYKELKKITPTLTWDEYLVFKSWEHTNYNPQSEAAMNGLLNSIGAESFTFIKCTKCGDLCLNTTGTKGHFRICLYCGYMCEVEGNKYKYILVLSEYNKDLKYDVDERGTVIVRNQT